MSEQAVWGIHAGKHGEAHELFVKNKVIAIGWPKLGDLSKYKDRDTYKKKYQEVYGGPIGALGNRAGMFYRLAREMQPGDLVVYPSKIDKQVYIGRITGSYMYSPDIDRRFPNQRKVQWRKNVPRTTFSQPALYEIGSALTLFQVKNYTDEFIAVLEGKPSEELLEEEEIGTISEDVEEQTKDFVLKQLKKYYKGEALEGLVVHLLEKMGYRARLTGKNNPSVDIIAHKDEFGFEPPLIKCQVKTEEGTIKLAPVEKLYSRVNQNEYGLFIALSDYNDKVYTFAEAKHNLRLVNGYELVDLILHYYDELDTKYKNTIPLGKIFLPSVTK